MVTATIEDIELNELKANLDKWEGDALPLVEEIKDEVTESRRAMDTDPPELYTLSNSLVDLSILNIRLIDRIIEGKYNLNAAKYLYESRREGWKVKLVKGYTTHHPKDSSKDEVIEGVAAGVADSMKVEKVAVEYELMNRAEKNYEMVNLLRRAIEKAIDSIRSKLSYESKHET